MKFSEVSTIRILIYFLGKCNVSHFEYKLYGKWHYQIEHYFNDYKNWIDLSLLFFKRVKLALSYVPMKFLHELGKFNKLLKSTYHFPFERINLKEHSLLCVGTPVILSRTCISLKITFPSGTHFSSAHFTTYLLFFFPLTATATTEDKEGKDARLSASSFTLFSITVAIVANRN